MASSRTRKRSTGRAGASRTSAPVRSAKKPAPQRSTRGRATSQQRSRRSPALGRAAGVLITVTLLLAIWMVYPVLRLQYQHRREVQSLEAELAGLQTRNEVLRGEVEGLKTPEGVERLARESLGLVKPGEQAYIVTGGESEDTTATIGYSVEPELPWWMQLADAIFGFE